MTSHSLLSTAGLRVTRDVHTPFLFIFSIFISILKKQDKDLRSSECEIIYHKVFSRLWNSAIKKQDVLMCKTNKEQLSINKGTWFNSSKIAFITKVYLQLLKKHQLDKKKKPT